jgi:hypothetical protein
MGYATSLVARAGTVELGLAGPFVAVTLGLEL